MDRDLKRFHEILPALMLRCGKVSQENYVELTAIAAVPYKLLQFDYLQRIFEIGLELVS